MGHRCCSKQKVRRGLWSPEEDEKLINHITAHGHGSWSSVPKRAGLQRCGKSCRLRWINYLRPELKRGTFTDEEEQIIIDVHRILGNRWAQIAKHLPGRTDNEVKNYWNSCIKKKLIAQGLDPQTHNLLPPPHRGSTTLEGSGHLLKRPNKYAFNTSCSSEITYSPTDELVIPSSSSAAAVLPSTAQSRDQNGRRMNHSPSGCSWMAGKEENNCNGSTMMINFCADGGLPPSSSSDPVKSNDQINCGVIGTLLEPNNALGDGGPCAMPTRLMDDAIGPLMPQAKVGEVLNDIALIGAGHTIGGGCADQEMLDASIFYNNNSDGYHDQYYGFDDLGSFADMSSTGAVNCCHNDLSYMDDLAWNF